MPDGTVETIRRQLRGMRDPSVARQSRKFFKTGKGEYGEEDQFLGIRVPALRRLVKAYANLTVMEMVELLTSVFHEERQLALFMLTAGVQKSGSEDQKKIYGLYLKHTAYINSWDLVDGSAPHIVGAY